MKKKNFIYNDDNMSYFSRLQNLIMKEFEEDYILLDFNKIKKLSFELEKEYYEEKENENEILEFL